MISSAEPYLFSRNKAALEVSGGLLLIFGYIWLVHSQYPSWLHVAFIVSFFGVIIFSKQSRKETFRDLGFRLDNLKSSMKFLCLPLVLATVTLCVVWSLIFPVDSEFYLNSKFWEKLIRYPLWALFQQYIALAFFFRRLKDIFYPSVVPAILLSAFIFAASHIPNPPLMIFTFLGGLFWAWAYHKHTNILTIAISHGVIGAILSNFLLVYTIVGPVSDTARWTKLSPVDYSLDAINGTIPPSGHPKIDIENSGNQMIVLQGWVKGIDGDVDKISINFEGKDYPVQYGLKRNDVANFYCSDDYLNSGFRADISVPHLEPGYYPLRVKIKLSKRSTFHYPGKRIWIGIQRP